MIISKRDLFFNYLHSSTEEMNKIISNKQRWYRVFDKTKPNDDGTPRLKNGKLETREIIHSFGRLKKIQRSLLDNVFHEIELLSCIRGATIGHDNISNADVHKGKKFRFQTDIHNFFPNITYKQVLEAFKAKKFPKQVAKIITDLVVYDTHLTQGPPTSPFVANLVFESIDKQILRLIGTRKITYTRWIDDLTFSSPDNFDDIHGHILGIIRKNGFKPHNKKTTARSKRSVITGISVGNNNIRPKDAFMNVDESQMSEAQKQGRKQYLNRVISRNK